MKQKPVKYKLLNGGLDHNFRYADIDATYDYDCKDKDCECRHGGYCRCATYENIEITSVNLKDIRSTLLSKSSKRKNAVSTSNTTFIDYCIDRILRYHKAYDPELWEVSVCPGYYGEEIDGYHFSAMNDLIHNVVKMIKMSVNNRIRYVLELEYGHILESLQTARFSEHTVSPDKITWGNPEYMMKKASRENLEYYKDHDLPVAICSMEGEKYKIIDGYHRFCANKDKKEVNIIVAK